MWPNGHGPKGDRTAPSTEEGIARSDAMLNGARYRPLPNSMEQVAREVQLKVVFPVTGCSPTRRKDARARTYHHVVW
ncbi:hypothetical protein Lfu02_05070 [Longispora fulva]|uniref:Uncharacterized protein n=1 Tax=Longispora fulva TaxID=619741 RepID=A0A8J7GBQ1_9ACTN|nr:hypothetical protein [Longispora fulva]GIG56135.1 hypothetical protein Lfu02_05070 [Longispora fulva]